MTAARPIVVGVDFTTSSRVALAQGARLAGQMRTAVKAIHVIETLAAVHLSDELSAFQVQVTASLIDEAKYLWKSFSEQTGNANVPMHIEINSPVAAMSYFCKQEQAQLLVVGTRGTGTSKGAGTVAASCVRRSPCDVLLIEEAYGPKKFETVLACVDFSETSKLAVERALRVAALDGAKVHVVYVFSAPWERMKPKAGTPEATEAFKAAYTSALAERVKAFCEEGLQTESTWAKPAYHAIPAEKHGKGIADFAKILGADLIVLGTRGASNIHDMLLGSTAEHVIRDAGRNVWAVRPKA
ncbi:MAG TPA: universal stress protein [Phycisphaerales bacterium]|nr:universal stress protein [Phycisphaerales bacterium]